MIARFIDILLPEIWRNVGEDRRNAALRYPVLQLNSQPADVTPEPDKYGAEECIIYFDKLDDNDEIMQCPCGHAFHDECVRIWFKQRFAYPKCQREFVWTMVLKEES